MPTTDRSHALDHVVALMFENRSFDTLLGQLYEPGEVASFEGVLGRELSNPIPDWAEDRSGRQAMPFGVADTMDTPNPDPGEEYQHVNTQLFGVIDPDGNRGVLAEHMAAPYNAPLRGVRQRWTASSPTTSVRSGRRWAVSRSSRSTRRSWPGTPRISCL
ncbi:hypothetical protein KJK32_32400 [Streptomyces sp. JCM17656]|nr:hypothetical protein KJK32_32400 [Streptomyces sp. JCM17656]